MDIQKITERSYIDEETGERIIVPVIHKNGSSHGFEMIFYGHLMEVINDLGNSKIKVLKHIVENRIKVNNAFLGTVREIAINTKTSTKTVHEVLKALEQKGFIRRKTGVIYIKSDLICDGRYKNSIMYTYANVGQMELPFQKEGTVKPLQEESKKAS